MAGSVPNNQQELLSDCTCPVCQEILVQPHRLTQCRHILCRKCIKKMTHKDSEMSQMESMMEASFLGLFGGRHSRTQSSSSSKRPVRCPICREKSDSSEPDATAEALVKVLHFLRNNRCCCTADECLEDATVLCPCCSKSFCQKHYDAQIAALKEAGETHCRELRSLLEPEAVQEDLGQLQAAVDGLNQLEATMVEILQLEMAKFRQQAKACRAQLLAPTVPDEARQALESDLEAATCHLKTDDMRSLAQLLPAAKRRLQTAQRKHPRKRLTLQFEPTQLTDEFTSLMLRRLSAATYQSPYSQLPSVLNRVTAKGLTVNPWDVSILSNLEGVVSVDGSLRLAAKGSKLSGPLLVINVQRFPTKLLHVTDLDVCQVATIKPQFGDEGMPGRMHIYNERQLIMTSDAGRHKVYVFNLDGEMVTSFGGKGDGPREFHAPLGIGANNGQMFVVDSKNKRVQVFDIDNSYALVATVTCEGFSNGIHSVLANNNSVFVVDRERSRLFVFDRNSRHLVNPELKLDGKPFDVVPDSFDNAIVTLMDEGKVQIVNRLGSLKTVGFKETHNHSRQDHEHMALPFLPFMPSEMGGTPPRMFHGAAYEPTNRRLFIADLMRKCIVVAEL